MCENRANKRDNKLCLFNSLTLNNVSQQQSNVSNEKFMRIIQTNQK